MPVSDFGSTTFSCSLAHWKSSSTLGFISSCRFFSLSSAGISFSGRSILNSSVIRSYASWAMDMQEKEELADRLRTAAIEKDEMASQINWLREQLNVLRTRKFSKNSEQVSSLQISLFNEAEDTLDHALPEDLSEDEITKAVPVKKHKNRKISAGSLPVKEIHHVVELLGND